MWGLPQKKNARRAYKIRLCGHLRRYKKIVKKTYIIYYNYLSYKCMGKWWFSSYKLKANQYVTLKISYSSTNKIRVGIVSKSRKYVALKNIKSNDIQRIKVGETDTYWIFVQNNSNKKITVNGIYIC